MPAENPDLCLDACSRTSGSGVIHAAIYRFLWEYPTPTAVLRAPGDEVRRLIEHPLGLADTRYRAVSGMSRAFLQEVRLESLRDQPCKI